MKKKVKLIKGIDSDQLEYRVNSFLESDNAKGYVVEDIKFQMGLDDGVLRYSALVIMEEESE